MSIRWLISELTLVSVMLLCAVPRSGAVDLRPDYAFLQSGGGMGRVSAGPGWSYGGNRQWETEIALGFIPKYDSGSAKALLALKENFVPWTVAINDRFSFRPLSVSLYFTTILSKKFWAAQPERYPSDYYLLQTKVRANISLGQRVDFRLRNPRLVRTITAYYEIGTCDIYAISAFGNHIAPRYWLQLTLGARVGF